MSVTLTWDDNNTDPNEEGHRVYRSTSTIDLNALPSPLATIAADLEIYEDDTAADETTYFYVVSAFTSFSEAFSSEVEITTGSGVVVEPNYHGLTRLLLNFDEANGASTGVDQSARAYTWTGSGNTNVQNGGVDLDGNGDRINFSSDNWDWNFLFDDSPFTVEIITDGQPDPQTFLFATSRGTAADRGFAIFIEADGDLRFFCANGFGAGSPRFDHLIPAASFTWNTSGPNHIVIEVGRVDASASNKIAAGFNGTREFLAGFAATAVNPGDSTYDLQVSGLPNGAAGWDTNGRLLGIRAFNGHHEYGLLASASYTPVYDSNEWPTAEVAASANVGIPQPRFFPEKQTPGSGEFDVKNYFAEPRCIQGATPNEVLCFGGLGVAHSMDTSYEIWMLRSVDYGRTFKADTAVLVVTDMNNAARNIAVGRDSTGRIIVTHREANSSDVSQGMFYVSSTDNGATWSAQTEITSLLTASTSGGPFGKGVPMSNGSLKFTFYTTDFCETLDWNPTTPGFGNRRTIYDYTSAPRQYNEPYCVSTDGDFFVWAPRIDVSPRTQFAFISSTDAGATVSVPVEAQYGISAVVNTAAPLCLEVFDGHVYMLMCNRSPFFNVFWSKTTIANFVANPKDVIDVNVATFTVIKQMFRGTGSPGDPEYGYGDLLSIPGSHIHASWYEGIKSSPSDETRFVHTTIT